MASGRIARTLDAIVFDLGRELRWSYLPPLMVYLAAGISGLTGIVGTFFVKEHLGLSAAFLAALGFWAGIPWALKMPIGHLVDLVWRWKAGLVYLGAALIAASVLIMYGLVVAPRAMAEWWPIEAWFVLGTLLSPVGYVLQDAVADAMTVEAVPTVDAHGRPRPEPELKAAHTTMQTLGRVATIGGLVAVAALNIFMFEGVETMSEAEKIATYGRIYLLSIVIPLVSILGVTLGAFIQASRARKLRREGLDRAVIAQILRGSAEDTRPNWAILGGSLAFVAFTLAIGLGGVPNDEEIVLAGSLAIVLLLMRWLIRELPQSQRRALIGTSIIIFVFRATPLAGPGATWWQIDVLGFDQRFLSVLTMFGTGLALFGMLVLRPMMGRRSIVEIMLFLTLLSGALSVPFIGLFYGLADWTAAHSFGIVDARFIVVVNTAFESPFGQLAMIPMLAWIAQNAPGHLKATFFAVMASFTNLALSLSSLGSKYLNEIYVVTREARDPASGAIVTQADYRQMGALLIAVTLLTVLLPLAAILLVQLSPLRTRQ